MKTIGYKGIVLLVLLLFPSTVVYGWEGRCTGSNVNVRTRPSLNSEVIAQLDKGQVVEVVEEGEEWVKIIAPKDASSWVYKELINKGIISGTNVNVRAGPGIAFPVLYKIQRGTHVKILEVRGDWVRIVPPVEFYAWVYKEYIEPVQEVKESEVRKEEIRAEEKKAELEEQEVRIPEEVVETVEEVGPVEIVQIQKVVEAKEVEEKIEEEPVLAELEVDEGVKFPEGLREGSFIGWLEDLGILINRPGTYKLVTYRGQWVAIIKTHYLDLNPFVGKRVKIEGPVISFSSSWKVPVVEVRKVKVVE